MKVAVIGAGVMGEALIAGLQRFGVSDIAIVEKNEARRDEIVTKYRVSVGGVEECDVVLLVTKPQDLDGVVTGLKLKSSALVISFAAGKKTSGIENLLPEGFRVVRVMPNTPLLISNGMSAVSAGKNATSEDIEWVRSFLLKSGKVIVVPEELQDAVTATSGSGPAYFFAMVEAMAGAAEKLGLSSDDAMTLAKETLIGAAAMLRESGKDAKTLRENVTSPKGTTAAALARLSESNFEGLVYEAMKAARDRSIELS